MIQELQFNYISNMFQALLVAYYPFQYSLHIWLYYCTLALLVSHYPLYKFAHLVVTFILLLLTFSFCSFAATPGGSCVVIYVKYCSATLSIVKCLFMLCMSLQPGAQPSYSVCVYPTCINLETLWLSVCGSVQPCLTMIDHSVSEHLLRCVSGTLSVCERVSIW